MSVRSDSCSCSCNRSTASARRVLEAGSGAATPGEWVSTLSGESQTPFQPSRRHPFNPVAEPFQTQLPSCTSTRVQSWDLHRTDAPFVGQPLADESARIPIHSTGLTQSRRALTGSRDPLEAPVISVHAFRRATLTCDPTERVLFHDHRHRFILKEERMRNGHHRIGEPEVDRSTVHRTNPPRSHTHVQQVAIGIPVHLRGLDQC